LTRLAISPLTSEPVKIFELEGKYVVVAARAVFTNMLLYEIAMSMGRRMSGTQYLALHKILRTYRLSI
jgi:hypothetical protein